MHYYKFHFFSVILVMQSSSVDIINADRPLSHSHHSDDRSTTDLQYEEHSGGVTSSDVVREDNPAF